MARPHPLSSPDACVQFYIEPWEKEVRRKLEAATAELFMTHQRSERSSVKVRVQTLRAVLRHLQGRSAPPHDSLVDQQREQIALLRTKLRDTKRKLQLLAERHRVQRKIIRELRGHAPSWSDGGRAGPGAPQRSSFSREAWAESSEEGGPAPSGEEEAGDEEGPELPMEEAELQEEDEETLCIKMSELRKITESRVRHLWAEPEAELGGRDQIYRKLRERGTEADRKWEEQEGKGGESKPQGGRRHDVMDCFRKMFTFFTRSSAPCRLEE